MSPATARSEVIRRIAAGELPTVADFVVIQANTGDGICKGCGLSLSAGEPRCVIDSVTAGLGPFPMHAECFLIWGEACMRTAMHEDRTRNVDGAGDLTLDAALSPAWLRTQMFCQIRLEMLNTRVRGAHEFAEAVRRLRKSGASAARAACAKAQRESNLAREAYDDHIRDHGCRAAAGHVSEFPSVRWFRERAHAQAPGQIIRVASCGRQLRSRMPLRIGPSRGPESKAP